jgi:hypothetical protein
MATQAPNVTLADALTGLFVYVQDVITKKITRIVFTEDTQIGLLNNPSELQLTGRLTLATNKYTSSPAAGGTAQVNLNEHDIVSLIYVTVINTTTNVMLPTSPRVGTVRFIKDAAGVASSTTKLIISDPSKAKIDGNANLTISTQYGSTFICWDGTQWLTICT